jgi:hypothetical protein
MGRLTELVEQTLGEGKSDSYIDWYSSNMGKKVKPKEKGWYVSFSNKSGDRDYVGPVKKNINNKEEALVVLKKLNPNDFPNGLSFAKVTGWGEIK